MPLKSRLTLDAAPSLNGVTVYMITPDTRARIGLGTLVKNGRRGRSALITSLSVSFNDAARKKKTS